MGTLVNIFNTQAYTFPVVASGVDDADKTLADAMESTDGLLKHMAFLDYNILSRYQQPRRMEMFELTAPNNQAHCWNRTSEAALKILQDTRVQLIEESGKKHEVKCTLKPAITKTVGTQGLFSAPEEAKTEPDVNKSWLLSPSKLLSSLAKSSEKKNVTITSPPLHQQVVSPAKPLLKEATPTKPIIDVFENLQMTLWCVEGISHLAAVSLSEDKY